MTKNLAILLCILIALILIVLPLVISRKAEKSQKKNKN
tara:strand:+ start:318 stop:431 length:114 start_codon:yes stop_codon:yes gene_type:complete